MDRRSFLGLGAALATAGVAGCLARSNRTETDRTPLGEPRSAEAAAAGQVDGASYIDDFPDVNEAVWYDDVDPESAPHYLEPSAREVGLGDPIAFTLYYQGDERLVTNYYDWHVAKRVDGRWLHVAPTVYPLPAMYLEPGSSHEWTLTPEDGDTEDGASVPQVGGTESLSVPALGGGRYLFGTAGNLTSGSRDDKTAFLARFDLDAEPLDLTPTDAVEGAKWEGDTLVAQTSRGDPDGEYANPTAYELERTDDPSADPRPTVTEQVVRYDTLRDALALARANDADSVRIEQYETAWPVFGLDDPGVIEYEGDVYETLERELSSSSSCGCE